MIRLAHISDIHIQEQQPAFGGASLNEQLEILTWIADDARDQRVELIVIAGDLYHQASQPAEREVAAEAVRRFAEVAPVVIVKGNHDVTKDLAILRRLKTASPVRVLESPEVFAFRRGQFDHPSGQTDLLNRDDAIIACIPWPRKAQLAAMAGPVDAGTLDAQAEKHMQNLLLGMGAQIQSSAVPRIVVAHLELGAALLDSGQPSVGRCDIELAQGDLDDMQADYCALGHIHQHQRLGDRICYSGSVRPVTFGQETPKGYCVVEIEHGEVPRIEHRRTPYLEMRTWESRWLTDEVEPRLLLEDPPFSGDISEWPKSWIKLRVACAADQQQQAKAAAQLIMEHMRAAGHQVKLVPDIAVVSRVRSEKFVRADTLEEKTRAWWADQGDTPARAEQILEKLRQVEEEHRGESV